MLNAIESLYQKSKTPKEFARGYLDHLCKILTTLDVDSIDSFIQILLKTRESNGTIFFIGNGGSAATSSHFANDIAVGTRSTKKPFRAIALTDNVAVITAIANDYSYDDIFLVQLKYLMRKGDVVVGISASGNSPNILKAIEYANSEGVHTVGLTGFDGGKLGKIVKNQIHVQTNKGEYGPVEDVHMVLDHLIGAFLIQLCRDESTQAID